MSEAVYLRLTDDDLSLVKKVAQEEQSKQSAVLKKIVQLSIHELRISRAINKYTSGQLTMRQAAREAGLNYFTFFEELSRRNLIGTLLKIEKIK